MHVQHILCRDTYCITVCATFTTLQKNKKLSRWTPPPPPLDPLYFPYQNHWISYFSLYLSESA